MKLPAFLAVVVMALPLCCPIGEIQAAPSPWYVRSSSVTNHLNGVAYGNGLFVAAGNEAAIVSSYGGASWNSRPSGVATATFTSAAFGNNRYVVVGKDGALARVSVDGITWSEGAIASGDQKFFAIAFRGYEFLAVGTDAVGSNSIFRSTLGTTWMPAPTRTTNMLLGVCPSEIAVGTNGTILTVDHSWSLDTWVARSSGTANTLRSVVRHQGRFIAGGDHGTILTSVDGVTWAAAAPASFDIRGLASSGDAVVAVGSYENLGRLQVSADGLTWAGTPLEFPESLNAVVYGDNQSFVAVGNNGLILQSIVGPLATTNEWTKSESGNWEEPYWSLNRLPAEEEGTVAFRNPGWKALAIGQNTTANFPGSLSLLNLRVESPTNSFNQLLLNWAGLDVPLTVRSNLLIGTNAALVSHSSAIQAQKVELYGTMTLADNSSAEQDHLTIHPGGLLHLDDSYLSCSSNFVSEPTGKFSSREAMLWVRQDVSLYDSVWKMTNVSFWADRMDVEGSSSFGQMGGTVNLSSLDLSFGGYSFSGGDYELDGGDLNIAGELYLSAGYFLQRSGTVRVGSMALSSVMQHKGSAIGSSYSLREGMLLDGNVDVYQSYISQEGGTHIVTNGVTITGGEVEAGSARNGYYDLNRGELAANELSLRQYARFYQTGGVCSVAGAITLNNSRNVHGYDAYTLKLQGGTLRCKDLLSVTNGGDIFQSGGSLTVSNTLFFEGRQHWTFQTGDFDTHYVFEGGLLSASNIEIYATWRIRGSSNINRINNQGYFKLGGTLALESTNLPVQERFGRFILASNAVINLPGSNSILEFAPSAQESWAAGAKLLITNWNGSLSGGSGERLVFGINATGLSSTQLGSIRFCIGTNELPAHILNTGEIVPIMPVAVSICMSISGSNLVLNWPSGDAWALERATNLPGPFIKVPGAVPPHTNLPTYPREFFRLSKPF